MSSYPDGPDSCFDDPTCDAVIGYNFGHPLCTFAYLYWGLCAVCVGAYLFWKYHTRLAEWLVEQLRNSCEQLPWKKEELLPVSVPDPSGKADPTGLYGSVAVESTTEVEMCGYKDVLLGTCAYTAMCLISLSWPLVYLVVLIDYYHNCQFTGIDGTCFYGDYFIFGDYDVNSRVFIATWALGTAWYALWLTFADDLRNLFRVRCECADAEHVWVFIKEEDEKILTLHVSDVVLLARRLKAWLKSFGDGRQGHALTAPVQRTPQGVKYIEVHGSRYVLQDQSFSKIAVPIGNTCGQVAGPENKRGLSSETARQRLDLIGFNAIPFEVDTWTVSICKELFTFYYLYQAVMYSVWFWFSYMFPVASILGSVVLVSAVIRMFVQRHAQRTIAAVAEYNTSVKVLRDGGWCTLSSRLLVPGDLLSVSGSASLAGGQDGEPWMLPCDAALITGSCICDESALTGEAMPIQKLRVPDDAKAAYGAGLPGSARHTLFSGTQVLQAGASADEWEVAAVVVATGIGTSKGGLVASMLYPEKVQFKYDEELRVVYAVLGAYALLCFALAVHFQVQSGQHSTWITKTMYGLFTLSQILCPLIPIALVVGQIQSSQRLRGLGVFCLSPDRIAISGKMRVFAFDKTGTLTKEGLDFLGVAEPEPEPEAEGEAGLGPMRAALEASPRMTQALASCHAVALFGDRFVGNQVEVKMLTATGWELEEAGGAAAVRAPGGGPRLAVERRFEFDHARMTMSVVVRDEDGVAHVFCKGSFERVAQLAPGGLPGNFLRRAHSLSLDGCYVLGMAHRCLGKVSREAVAALEREEVEAAELAALGLVVFRNELKADTPEAIAALKQGAVRPIMITGDNAQCGQHIARECGMIAKDSVVYLADVAPDNAKQVVWADARHSGDSIPAEGEAGKRLLSTEDIEEMVRAGPMEGRELAVTGRAFDQLVASGRMQALLLHTRVFARVSPRNKIDVVAMHQRLGLVTGMCGDGGNDCGALRVAHAGVSLSDADTSLVAPFTSNTKSVASCVDLLREGRAALHTSFASFKFLIMYGQVFSILKLVSYWYGVIMCNADYLMIDAVAILSLSYAMTLSKPLPTLGATRPTSSLLGPTSVASTLGMHVINLSFMAGALVMMEMSADYVAWPSHLSQGTTTWLLSDNWETTILFVVGYFQFVTSAIIFTFGCTFRRPVWHNTVCCAVWGSLWVLTSLLILMDQNALTEIFHIASQQFNGDSPTNPAWVEYQAQGGEPSPGMSGGFRVRLWVLVQCNLALNAAWQRFSVEGPIADHIRAMFPSDRPKFRL